MESFLGEGSLGVPSIHRLRMFKTVESRGSTEVRVVSAVRTHLLGMVRFFDSGALEGKGASGWI
jgi:hypothetical protein